MLKKFGLAAAVLCSSVVLAQGADKTGEAYMSVDQFHWSGWYVGIEAGFGSGDVNLIDAPTFTIIDLPASFSPDGALGGVTSGVNWQSGDWVFGLEASWLGGTLEQTRTLSLGDYTVSMKDIVTIGPKIGLAVDDWLFYGEAGYASAEVDLTVVLNAANGGATHDFFEERTDGYYVGFGMDVALDDNWIMGAEYNHLELEDVNLYNAATAVAASLGGTASDTSVDIIKLKFTYKFN